MTLSIQHKRSTVAGHQPSASSLLEGELAVNLADKKLYSKDQTGAIIELGGVAETQVTATIERQLRLTIDAAAGDDTRADSDYLEPNRRPFKTFAALRKFCKRTQVTNLEIEVLGALNISEGITGKVWSFHEDSVTFRIQGNLDGNQTTLLGKRFVVQSVGSTTLRVQGIAFGAEDNYVDLVDIDCATATGSAPSTWNWVYAERVYLRGGQPGAAVTIAARTVGEVHLMPGANIRIGVANAATLQAPENWCIKGGFVGSNAADTGLTFTAPSRALAVHVMPGRLFLPSAQRAAIPIVTFETGTTVSNTELLVIDPFSGMITYCIRDVPLYNNANPTFQSMQLTLPINIAHMIITKATYSSDQMAKVGTRITARQIAPNKVEVEGDFHGADIPFSLLCVGF